MDNKKKGLKFYSEKLKKEEFELKGQTNKSIDYKKKPFSELFYKSGFTWIAFLSCIFSFVYCIYQINKELDQISDQIPLFYISNQQIWELFGKNFLYLMLIVPIINIALLFFVIKPIHKIQPRLATGLSIFINFTNLFAISALAGIITLVK